MTLSRHSLSLWKLRRNQAGLVYLVHATGHPKGKREMKEAMFESLDGLRAFLGAKHPSVAAAAAGQMDLFSSEVRMDLAVDYAHLRELLQTRFANRRMEYEDLQNETAVGHEFDGYIDNHIKTALEELADRQAIKRFRRGIPSARKLTKGDEVEFPPV
jgi:hypothetical protein